MKRQIVFDDFNKIFDMPLCGTIIEEEYDDADNYMHWGGTEPGPKSPRWGMKNSKEWCELMSEKMSGEGNPFYGRKHTEETKKKLSESRKKTHNTPQFLEKHRQRYAKQRWYFIDPSGEKVTVEGSLNKFCGDNSLNTGAMCQVHKGNKTHHKGWRKA